jgi:hypothetical protein
MISIRVLGTFGKYVLQLMFKRLILMNVAFHLFVALILIKSKNIMITKIIKFHSKHSINKNVNEKNLIPLQQKMIKANRNYSLSFL